MVTLLIIGCVVGGQLREGKRYGRTRQQEALNKKRIPEQYTPPAQKSTEIV